jgi:tetratricopeptide (TPR) repeat protein
LTILHFLSLCKKHSALEAQGKDCLRYEEFNDWLGVTYQEAGQYEKSVEIAKKALPGATKFKLNFLNIIAEAELRTGSETEAIKQAEEIGYDYPNFVPILGFLGEIAVKKQDWNTALVYSEKMYRIDKSALSLLGMAADLLQLGCHEDTLNVVFKALTTEPERIGKITGVLEGIYSLAILSRKAETAEHLDAISSQILIGVKTTPLCKLPKSWV